MKRKRWWWCVVSAAGWVVGIAGAPDDLRTWHRWLGAVDWDVVRLVALILAPVTLAIPITMEMRDWWRRRWRNRWATSGDTEKFLARREMARDGLSVLESTDPARRWIPHARKILDEFEEAHPEAVRDGHINIEVFRQWESER